MKTFSQFIVEADISRGLRAVHYGTQYAGKKAVPFITTHALSMLPKLKALEAVPKNIAPMSSVITTGIGAGMALSKVLNLLAQRNREEQKKKREQLIPSGNQPYGTGRVARVTEQIVPMKTTVLGPDLQSLPHIDTRGPGEKLRSVMRQKNYMDATGRKPPKIP
jgi:ABC-type enterochelin transport system ATPase subunit